MTTNRPLSLLILIFALVGCGFAPAIKPESRAQLAQIHVAPIAEREGQVLKIALNNQLNPKGLKIGPVYTLNLSLQTSTSQSYAISSVVTRGLGTMTATGNLQDLTGKVVWSGSISHSALFAQHELPSLTAEAKANLWKDLANLIAQDLRLVLAQALEAL